jgi:hypothetical protein
MRWGGAESLRRNSMIYDIDVITVVPNSVATVIWDRGWEAEDLSIYKDTDYYPWPA